MTRTPMIERLARAAHRAELALNNEKNETVIEIDWEMHGWRYIEGQRAALTPLLDPTPEMVEAGAHKLGDGYADDDDRFWAKSVFNAMIKAIQEGE